MNIIDMAAAVVSGICASMGLGGGTVLILYLTLLRSIDRTTASGINLLFFIPAALVSVISSIKKGVYGIKELLPFVGIGLVFSAVGTFLALYLKSDIIQTAFGILLVFMGVCEGIKAIKGDKWR